VVPVSNCKSLDRLNEMSTPSEFEEQWAAMRVRFAQRLVSRVERMRSAWAIFENSVAPAPQAQEDLFHEAHSLAGSAATFGHPELGEAARALELKVDPKRVGTLSAHAPHGHELHDLMMRVVSLARIVNPDA
jgi:HPt (histidine-containing phosphotransfer) domain-containing protein